MQTRIRSVLAAAFGLALAGSLAHAELLLSGSTTGSFVDPSLPNTTVVNAADGSSASFTTGIPTPPNTTPTSISFSNNTFANVSSGENIQVGLFTIHNGSDNLGSDAAHATFNLGLNLTSPVMSTMLLTPIDFAIDNTPNTAGGVPDTFAATFSQPAPMWINGYKVWFKLNFTPTDIVVPENSTVVKGDVTVYFTPVPEPATYAMFGAALLIGLVVYRRFRGDKSLPGAPVAA